MITAPCAMAQRLAVATHAHAHAHTHTHITVAWHPIQWPVQAKPLTNHTYVGHGNAMRTDRGAEQVMRCAHCTMFYQQWLVSLRVRVHVCVRASDETEERRKTERKREDRKRKDRNDVERERGKEERERGKNKKSTKAGSLR